MNVRDSEVIAGLLIKQGYQITADETDTDILIYNTCSVRQHAEDKVWSELGRVAKFKGQSPSGTVPIIGLVGCMAQSYKDDVFRRAHQVDFVVGPSDINKIPEIIEKLSAKHYPLNANNLFESKIWETDGGLRPEEIYHTGFYEDKNHAYVVISEGCSNSCSYCVVPYVRGALKNRNYRNIINEIDQIVDKGITNITLLGQNVNAYQYNDINFVKLLELVNHINGLRQFSFITSHPKDTDFDLFKAMKDLDKVKKYLHLPVQSGSDRILQLMNRGYNRGGYLNLIQAYREIVKNGALTTDIIVGFPGETEQEFKDTYNLVKELGFNSAYIFKYSPRPHTQAEAFDDDVPKQEKERRHQLILNLQKGISKSRHGSE
jgi:tRNA-2-methylthio-N6-dimethylallyladenosine synthase